MLENETEHETEFSQAIEEGIDVLSIGDETSRLLRERVDALIASGIPLPDAFGLAYLDVPAHDCRELLRRGCPRDLVGAILA
jgi:hypothetical protein